MTIPTPIDDSLKLAILSRILESPEFKDSKRSQELLQYLVQASLDKKSPKETTIAMEFFGKDTKFDPKEDPTVRVQMNYLRKKLEHYYLTTQDTSPFRLEIPKGHYLVEFTPQPEREPSRLHRPYAIPLLGILITLLATTVIYLLLTRPAGPGAAATSHTTDPLWAEFVRENGRPTLVVVGDYFFLFDKSLSVKPGVMVRFPLINSEEDLRAVVHEDAAFAQRYVQSSFTFIRPSGAWGIAEVLPILKESAVPVSLKLASQLTLDDLSTFNIVYIGSFKTLHSLNRVLHRFELEYKLSPAVVTLTTSSSDSSVTFFPQAVVGGAYERDYAVIAKDVGPEGNAVLLLLGFGDAGVLQAVKAAAGPDLISQIETQYGNLTQPLIPLRCNIVFEAEGIDQTGFKLALKYFRRTDTSPSPPSTK